MSEVDSMQMRAVLLTVLTIAATGGPALAQSNHDIFWHRVSPDPAK